jgi:hypothetical protein
MCIYQDKFLEIAQNAEFIGNTAEQRQYRVTLPATTDLDYYIQSTGRGKDFDFFPLRADDHSNIQDKISDALTRVADLQSEKTLADFKALVVAEAQDSAYKFNLGALSQAEHILLQISTYSKIIDDLKQALLDIINQEKANNKDDTIIKVPVIYGLKDLMRILKLGRNNVLELLQTGKIRSLSLGRPRKPGDAWHVTAEQLDEFIKQNS